MLARTVTAIPGNGRPPISHGTLTDLNVDDHSIYALLAGRVANQTLVGGTAAGGFIGLRGSSDAGLGEIRYQSPFRAGSDWSAILTGGHRVFEFAPASANVAGGLTFIEGALFDPTYVVDTTALIYTAVQGKGTFINSALPNTTFSQWFLFRGNPNMTSDDVAFHALNSTILNAAPRYYADGLGNLTATPSVLGMAFVPLLEAIQAGDGVSVTTMAAVSVTPKWHTANATASINFGTIYGLHCQDLNARVFGSSLGTESYAAYHGIHFENLTALTPSGFNVVVFSALVASAKNLFISNTGGAASQDAGEYRWIGGGRPTVLQDGVGLFLGLTRDVEIRWAATDQLQFVPTADTNDGFDFSWNHTLNFLSWNAFSTASPFGLRVQFQRFAFGAQSTVPNPSSTAAAFLVSIDARTPPAAGVWTDFLVDGGRTAVLVNALAMTTVGAARIDPLNPTITSGSIANLSTLHVNSMGTSGALNQGLWVDRARMRVDGRSNYGAASPAQITADQNDYAIPTGTSGRTVHRITTDASRTITGIVAGQAGDLIIFTNVGSNPAVLAHQNASSSAANRVISPTGANLTVSANQSAALWYDATTARWRILFHTGA